MIGHCIYTCSHLQCIFWLSLWQKLTKLVKVLWSTKDGWWVTSYEVGKIMFSKILKHYFAKDLETWKLRSTNTMAMNIHQTSLWNFTRKNPHSYKERPSTCIVQVFLSTTIAIALQYFVTNFATTQQIVSTIVLFHVVHLLLVLQHRAKLEHHCTIFSPSLKTLFGFS
jgi:hypothetical protein